MTSHRTAPNRGIAAGRRTISVLVAVAVAGAVVAGAAWWLWPDEAAAEQRMPAGPYLVRLSGSPHRGPTAVEFGLTDRQSVPTPAARVSVQPAMPQMGHAIPPVSAEPVAPGRFRATVDLPMSGQWEIAVQISGPQGPGTATFSVAVA